MATWFSASTPEAQERLLSAWHDAPTSNEEVCGMLLDVAREQVMEFAPAPTDPAELITAVLGGIGHTPDTIADILAILELEQAAVPVRYVYAQLQQARNLWNAGRTDSAGDIGEGGYTFTSRPLDRTIRDIIRPRNVRPDVY